MVKSDTWSCKCDTLVPKLASTTSKPIAINAIASFGMFY
jgi:hypothetical protein